MLSIESLNLFHGVRFPLWVVKHVHFPKKENLGGLKKRDAPKHTTSSRSYLSFVQESFEIEFKLARFSRRLAALF